MNVYEHKVNITTNGGSVSSTTLNVRGGILRYFLVRALTSGTTQFRADLVDEDSTTRLNYAYHNGEIVDDKITLPVVGNYTLNITNASADETFRVIFSVQE